MRSRLAQADATDGSRLTTGGKKELAELRRDKRRLEMENNILKRAAYFARENVSPTSASDRGGARGCSLAG
ncbi:MAG: hypothetical protein ACRDRI_25400 [Pseudonocardiaceae bacterium]